MCIICKGEVITEKYLNCSGCNKVKEININGIYKLYVNNCANLERITSNILVELFCDNCPKLKIIPNVEYILSCKNCRYLFNINDVRCVYYCPPWLNHIHNYNYDSNIDKLIKLQRFFRKKLSKRLHFSISKV